jgi:NAD(P)-dependent dehydrogenase (short-subunit alcohol dehydrogenase family)
MLTDYRGKAVLVTGGTKGIGLAVGLAFGRRGAHVTLTSKWGSADAAQIKDAFAEASAPEPDVVEADASQPDDARAVLTRIKESHESLHAFVSNVAFGSVVKSFEDYELRGLTAGIGYSAWPIVTHTQAAHEVFGAYPRHVVGISSMGAEALHTSYDLIGPTKAVLESLCRYMNYRLDREGVRVNVVRTRFVRTESLDATFGEAFVPFVERYAPDLFTAAGDIGEAVYGVCSGLMDGLGGQVITIDGGASFADGFSRLYREREINGIGKKESNRGA